MASIQPGTGLGFGPRHIDFHPTQPWVYVSVERQNKLYVYALQADGGLGRDPIFMKETLADPANVKPSQGAGPIHVHPNGRSQTRRGLTSAEREGAWVSAEQESAAAAWSGRS